jgi:hypothetical protein
MESHENTADAENPQEIDLIFGRKEVLSGNGRS